MRIVTMRIVPNIVALPHACQTLWREGDEKPMDAHADDNDKSNDFDHVDDLDWKARAAIYRFIVEHERPPTTDEVAAILRMTSARAALAFQRLNRHHAIFLEPGTLTIRMAHPFSAIPTLFRVQSNGRSYWANCAWDMLGIPAALHADAEIAAHYADAAHTPVTLKVANDTVHSQGEVIHFPLPFQRWYDDLVHT